MLMVDGSLGLHHRTEPFKGANRKVKAIQDQSLVVEFAEQTSSMRLSSEAFAQTLSNVRSACERYGIPLD